MARHRKRTVNPESGINITPLGDVSLSLLLGFLVITPIITETLSATLPQEGSGVASGAIRQDPIVVVTAEGIILINGKEVTEGEIPAKMAELFPEGAEIERKVLFTGSGEIPYRDIIRILDLLKLNGVEAIGIR